MSPSGNVHYLWWKRFFWLALIGCAGITLRSVPLGLGFLFGYLMGRYIDPDADLQQTSSSEYRAMRELSIVGVVLVAYFVPYGYVVPHRSPLSHYPVLGTLGRLIYLFWWLPILFYYFDWQVSNIMLLVAYNIFIGLSLSDFIHWLLDVTHE